MDDWQLNPAKDIGLPAFQRHRSLLRETGLPESILRMLWRGCVQGWLGGVHRFRVKGAANLPTSGGFVLVSNHASHLDALVLAAALPMRWRDRVFPIAAADVFFQRPAKASFAAIAINALPVERSKSRRQAIAELRRRLLEEQSIYILFPEGTRTRNGQLLPFRAGVGALVAQTDTPVLPCYLAGTFDALPPGWLVPRPRPIHLQIGRPLRFAGTADSREGWADISARLELAVRELARSSIIRAGSKAK
jgi:1-acyl-sn-glycerol-3-phosphate acyltransferase